MHLQSVPYDFACLRILVAARNPDFLCAEITPEAWERGHLESAEVEIREALAAVEASTDIVLVPVVPSMKSYAEFAPQSGWRRNIAQTGMKLLRWGQQKAGTPEAIHGRLFSAYCHMLCTLTEASWNPEERAAWDQQNQEMTNNILQIIRRDPGRRVLVVVQCQRMHRLTQLLKAHPEELELVRYQEL